MTTLYVPIALAAVGIVLRGAGFAFRKSIRRLELRRAMGAIFALSSVLTPFFMGTVVGAIAAGNVPAAGNGDAFSSWLAPLPLLTGALFVLSGAYLAAIFLVADSHRAGEKAMEGYFAGRALVAGLLAGAVALFGLIALHGEARYVYDRLIVEGLPLVIVSMLCGFGVLALLLGRRRRGLRPLAAGAVVAVVWGWGVAQFPYLLPTSLRIDQAAAPSATLDSVLVVFAIAAVVVLPALGLLYWLSQRELWVSDGGSPRAVLFDIDGTLLVTGGAGGVAWQRGFEQLYGVEADIAEHTDAGMTDPEIVKIVFREVIGREGTPRSAPRRSPPTSSTCPTRSPSPAATG